MVHQWTVLHLCVLPPPHHERMCFRWRPGSLCQHHPTVSCNELVSIMIANAATATEPLLPQGRNVLLLRCVKQPHVKQTGASELDGRPAAMSPQQQMDQRKRGQKGRGVCNDSVWLRITSRLGAAEFMLLNNTSCLFWSHVVNTGVISIRIFQFHCQCNHSVLILLLCETYG